MSQKTNRKSRLQRKADRVFKSEADRRFNEALGAARTARDTARREANVEYEKGVAKLDEARTKARFEAEKAYGETRNELVKKYGREEAAA